MANGKIGKENFNKSKVMFFARAVNYQIFEFLEFVDVIYQLYQSHKGDKDCDIRLGSD